MRRVRREIRVLISKRAIVRGTLKYVFQKKKKKRVSKLATRRRSKDLLSSSRSNNFRINFKWRSSTALPTPCKVVHVTCRDSTRDYIHSICVSQDETAEFDVNLTHFAESIEKKINPALPADRNHSVLARLPFSLSRVSGVYINFFFCFPLLSSRIDLDRDDFSPFPLCRVSKITFVQFCAAIYTLVAALIDTRTDIGVPAKTIFHYKSKDIFKYTCKCLIPAEIGYFS